MSAKTKLLGQYRLGKTVGQGAFAKVKLATHRDTGDKVAIKMIDKVTLAQKAAKSKAEKLAKLKQPQESQPKVDVPEPEQVGPAQPSFVSTIQTEVQLLMRLEHPNIIKIFQVMETETECFVVMEYAEGGELVEYISSRERLTEKEARRLFRQLISAMDHCHRASVVHRDLKLENLLLTANGNILVSDFGLGRTFNPNNYQDMQTFCGTPTYAAIELISGIPYKGDKSDIWAMGVVLFIMTSGKPPFLGSSIPSLYKKIKALKYSCPKYFSAELVALFGRIFVKDPATRISMAELSVDRWVNIDCDSPPEVIEPKLTGVVDNHALGATISGVYYDMTHVVYSFRSHKKSNDRPGSGVKTRSRRSQTVSSNIDASTLIRKKSITLANCPSSQTSTSEIISPETQTNSRKHSHSSKFSIKRLSTLINRPIKPVDIEDSRSPPMSPPPAFGQPPRHRRLSLQEGIPKVVIQPPPLDGTRELPTRKSNALQIVAEEITARDSTSNAKRSEELQVQPTCPRGRRASMSMVPKSDFTHTVTTSAAMPAIEKPIEHQRLKNPSMSGSNPINNGKGSDDDTEAPYGLFAELAAANPDMNLRDLLAQKSIARHQSEFDYSSDGSSGDPVKLGNPANPQKTPDNLIVDVLKAFDLTSELPNDRQSKLNRRMSMVSPNAEFSHGPTSSRSGDDNDKKSIRSQEIMEPTEQEITEWHQIHRQPRKIRTGRFSFKPSQTSMLDPSSMFQTLHKALCDIKLRTKGIFLFERVPDYYMFNCRAEKSDLGTWTRFEIEICKVPLLSVHGLRLKRKGGNALLYKEMHSTICEAVNWSN